MRSDPQASCVHQCHQDHTDTQSRKRGAAAETHAYGQHEAERPECLDGVLFECSGLVDECARRVEPIQRVRGGGHELQPSRPSSPKSSTLTAIQHSHSPEDAIPASCNLAASTVRTMQDC